MVTWHCTFDRQKNSDSCTVVSRRVYRERASAEIGLYKNPTTMQRSFAVALVTVANAAYVAPPQLSSKAAAQAHSRMTELRMAGNVVVTVSAEPHAPINKSHNQLKHQLQSSH